MTVPVQNPSIQYTGNGATKVFPFPFTILSSSDVVVLLDGVPQSLGVQYTLDGVGNQTGGTVTFSVVPTAGAVITIYRDVSIERDTDYQDNGDLLADTVNSDFDRIWMAMQDANFGLTRAVQVPRSDVNPNMVLPPASQRANKALGFDNDGNPFAIQLTIGNVTAPVLNSIAMLRLVTVAAPVFVTGWRIAGDGGGGAYQPLDPSDMRPDNGGTVIRTASGIGFGLQLTGPVSIKQFGAYGDGVHSDDDAMTRWLAALSTTLKGYVPAGTYNFTSPKVKPPTNYISIQGDGVPQSRFVYVGAATTGDIWTFGDGVTSVMGLNLADFMLDSTTAMTGGTGIRIKKHQNNGGIALNVYIGSDSRKLWDGIWFDNVNVFKYDGFDIRVQNEGLIVNGTATDDTGSDLRLDHGFILGGTNQIHCAGGFGGLYLGQVLAYGATAVSMLIDQARANRTNREIIHSNECVLDGGTQALLRIYNPGGILIVDCNAFLSGAGFFGGTTGDNIDIQSMPLGRLTIGSSHIKSAKRHGISIGDNAAFVSISDKTLITDCGGWGVYSAASNVNVQNEARVMFNTLGNVHPNVQAFVQTGTGIGATSGTITTSSGFLRYRLGGGVCKAYSELTITTNGTGSGALIQSMPFPIKGNCVGHGLVETTGKAVSVRGNAADGFNVTILNADGTYPGANGTVIRTWIEYEYQN